MTPDHIPDAGKMMPAALRLADHLERFRSFPDDLAAAAELRRLHAEIEATERQVEILTDELSKCSKENAKLREALKEVGLFLHHAWCDVQMNEYSLEKLNKTMEVVDAALAQGDKG